MCCLIIIGGGARLGVLWEMQGAQQLAYDATSNTVFLAAGNSTGGLGKGHGCDDGDGNEENGSWMRKSTGELSRSTACLSVDDALLSVQCCAVLMRIVDRFAYQTKANRGRPHSRWLPLRRRRTVRPP
eukprot:SAG22_NODE_9896_length_564_cov_1.193548_1_plen_128_part_00